LKQLRKSIRAIALLISLLFSVLVLYGSYSLSTYGSRWFASSKNAFLYDQMKEIIPGDILDRKGIRLAYSENGTRMYQEDLKSRESVVHVVGDSNSNIANGVESFMAYYLYGFSATYLERLNFEIGGIPRRGDDVTITIDSRLSTFIAGKFPNGSSGAVVVMNYKTGELLSLQSFPLFDPMNDAQPGVNRGKGIYVNKATQWCSAPGSAFKVITLSSALENLPGATNAVFSCSGQLPLPERAITDAGNVSHGDLNLRTAFSQSCNVTFAQLALALGDQTLRETAEDYGFDDNFLFRDIVVENSSYPAIESPTLEIMPFLAKTPFLTLIEHKFQSDVDLAWTGVGQSTLLTTPLHMCMVAAAIANGGVMMEPRLLLAAKSVSGKVRTTFSTQVYRRCVSLGVAAVIADYMRTVVTGGTGTAAYIPGMDIRGKTGTAEIDNQENPNAWFIGYIASDKAPYALCVVVENAKTLSGGIGSGGSVAAPLAKQIFQYLAGE
jgi:penicillin-binding protein A